MKAAIAWIEFIDVLLVEGSHLFVRIVEFEKKEIIHLPSDN